MGQDRDAIIAAAVGVAAAAAACIAWCAQRAIKAADHRERDEDADEGDIYTDAPYELMVLARSAIEYSEECDTPAAGDMRDGFAKVLDAARVYGDTERRAREMRRRFHGRIAPAQPEESGKPEGADNDVREANEYLKGKNAELLDEIKRYRDEAAQLRQELRA